MIGDEKLKIIVLSQGIFGNRVVNTLKNKGPSRWTIHAVYVPKVDYEIALDEPESVHLEGLTKCDLLISTCEEPSAMLLLPTIAERTEASSIIVAIDSPRWSPGLGMEAQIREELGEKGVTCVFARPFCTLDPIGDPFTDEFAKFFGRPELELSISNNVIVKASVRRSAPCGSTFFIAEKLVGIKSSEAILQSGLFLHYYPCLASMEHDPVLNETPMHIAGFEIKKAVYHALKKALKRVRKAKEY